MTQVRGGLVAVLLLGSTVSSWLAGCQTAERVYFDDDDGAAGILAATGGVASEAAGGSNAARETGSAPPAVTAGSSGSSGAGGSVGQSSAGGSVGEASSLGEANGGVAGARAFDDARRYAACAKYMTTRCRRLDECFANGSHNACLTELMALCPDYFFAPGSRITFEALEECTNQQETASCQQTEEGGIPGCDFAPGARAAGSPCMFDNQCAERTCSGYDRVCGKCLPLVGEDWYCGADAACAPGLDCVGGRCARRAPDRSTPMGEPCRTSVQCQEGLICGAGPNDTAACVPPTRSGEACGASWFCESGACDSKTGLCAELPEVGAGCLEEGGALRCAAGAVCDEREVPPRCIAPIEVGEPCFLPSDGYLRDSCELGSVCVCSDVTCSNRVCRVPVPPLGDCSAAHSFCVSGTECRAGRCEAVAPRHLFEEQCLP
jgi:hypothetical protein